MAAYRPAKCLLRLSIGIETTRTACCLSVARKKYARKRECRLLRRCRPSAPSPLLPFTAIYSSESTQQGNYKSPLQPLTTTTANATVKMSFLSRKALPNILVHFVDVSDRTEQQLLLDGIEKTIASTYGVDRFVVYSVDSSELNGDSRVYSASLMLTIYKDKEPKQQATSNKLPQLALPFNQLLPNWPGAKHFACEFFAKSIQKCLPTEERTSPSTSTQECSDMYADTAVYVFDSKRNYDAWLKMQLADKRVNLIELHPGQSHKADQNDAFFVDWQRYDQLASAVEGFNAKRFFNNLETNYLGRSVVFADRVSSTMELVTRFKQVNGIVAIANYQTNGIGRNANKWLSPKGCAMFTLSLELATTSVLMARLPLLQHLASLSVILALPSTELNVRIKWPNDILFTESMSKLAGILTRSYCYGNKVNVQIGMGINMSNRHPSVCIDELIELYNSRQPALSANRLNLMPAETFIARILNNLERLIDMLNEGSGTGRLADIKQMYIDNWVHSDALVDIRSTDPEGAVRKARICGINDDGYLLAEDLLTGELMNLKPDGNRFDLMHNLIILNS